MAAYNGDIYDNLSLCSIIYCLSRWNIDRKILMQNILAIIIGIVASIYVIKIFIRQFSQSEKNPKCENCPIPEIINKQKKSILE